MTVLEVIQRSTEFLARKGVDSPRLQVELLLAHALGVPRLKLYLDFERQLTSAELDSVRQLIKRRSSREPLQHIVGSTSFCGLEILVNGTVLIPRPETEVLAERAWRYLQGLAQHATTLSALDFGTGSGCLAVTIAHHVSSVRVYAVDISHASLELAQANAVRHHVADRIRFYEGNGFAPLPKDASFDLIVSNPPYIPSSEVDQLAPEVRDHDPRLALDGGSDGLSFFRRLAEHATVFLRPGGQLMCEFGDGQQDSVTEVFRAQGWRVQEIVPDLSHRPRILVACGAKS